MSSMPSSALWRLVSFFIVHLLVAYSIKDDSFNSCDANDSTDCGEKTSSKLSIMEEAAIYQKGEESSHKYWSYLQLIHDANRTFVPCTKNCSCHYPQINTDLLPFKKGISLSAIEDARKSGTLYQVIGGKVYREQNCMFPSRCAGVEHFLNEIADGIQDTELIINVRDWPQVYRGARTGIKSPVFSFSKQEGVHGDILYPAWSFWEGGPAISLHPTGLGRWDVRRKTINEAAKQHPWNKKENKAFFRGSRTSSDRDSVVLLSRERPDLVDASYTKNQAWKSPKDTLNAEPAAEVTLENHCQYKYLFNFHGVAASFRFKHLFLCGSLVFHEADDWIEFFYPQMKPWIHYVPFPPRASAEELRDLLQFVLENDAEAEQIARRGRSFISQHLRMSDVRCYWRKLLKTYTKLLQYVPKRRSDLQLIPKK